MDKEFQYRLLRAMSDKQISASELSKASGVGKSDISNYVNGKYVPKQDKCYMLALALDVDPGWLMTGDEPLTPRMAETLEEENVLIAHWRQADESIRHAVRILLKIEE